MTIDLSEYGPVIGDSVVASEIYHKIYSVVRNTSVVIDMAGVKLMATFCAKQIFGKLYLELGPNDFYDKIQIKNASDNIKTTIGIGIETSLNESKF